jgi:hypothetical protein
MVLADLEGGKRRQDRFALLAALARATAFNGAYALMPEGALIRVAFEREADALVFAESVGARKTAREGGWAGQWAFLFDTGAEATIKAVLPPSTQRRLRQSTGQPRRRAG